MLPTDSGGDNPGFVTVGYFGGRSFVPGKAAATLLNSLWLASKDELFCGERRCIMSTMGPQVVLGFFKEKNTNPIYVNEYIYSMEACLPFENESIMTPRHTTYTTYAAHYHVYTEKKNCVNS